MTSRLFNVALPHHTYSLFNFTYNFSWRYVGKRHTLRRGRRPRRPALTNASQTQHHFSAPSDEGAGLRQQDWGRDKKQKQKNQSSSRARARIYLLFFIFYIIFLFIYLGCQKWHLGSIRNDTSEVSPVTPALQNWHLGSFNLTPGVQIWHHVFGGDYMLPLHVILSVCEESPVCWRKW